MSTPILKLRDAINEAGGRPYTGGKVPVDNDVSAPNLHWRYDVLHGELMGPRGRQRAERNHGAGAGGSGVMRSM